MDDPPASSPPSAGQAFGKGGCGCLIAFLVIAALCLLLGGRVHIDLLGVVVLFVIGGLIGLVVRYIYIRGRRDGGGSGDR